MTKDKFKKWMDKHNLTYSTAAPFLGVDPRTIRRYENGESKIDGKVVLLMMYYDLALRLGFDPLQN